jgi:uncharacterized protein (DUF58 family)
MGCFIMLLTVLAFIAGRLRNELALSLLGAVFLTILVYCFFAVLILGLLQRRKVRSLSVKMSSNTVTVGKQAEMRLDHRKKFFRLPAVLVRYEVKLETRDGRKLRHVFDPDHALNNWTSFPVERRGAYYGSFDELVFCDVPGFFRLAFRVYQHEKDDAASLSPRLLAAPLAAADLIPVTIRSGGDERRTSANYQRTDNLIDHRPYIPGDDPRRINWKLYGHAGDLFVREGESEPPPHSRLSILIDTQADTELFDAGAARNAVDLLCENALAAALDFTDSGMDVLIAYAGAHVPAAAVREAGASRRITDADLAAALAYPAASPWPAAGQTIDADLPLLSEDRGVLILALPRTGADSTALDRFLKKRPPAQAVDLLFLYAGETPRRNAAVRRNVTLDEAAETCVRMYDKRGNVRARKLQCLGNEELESRS